MKATAVRLRDAALAFLIRLRSDEPLRNKLYPFIALVSGWIVREGYVSDSVMQIVLGVVFLVGGWGAVEWARRLVTPLSKVGPLVADRAQQGYNDGVQDAAEAVVGELSSRAQASLATLSPHVQEMLDRAREAGTYFGNRGEHRAQ